MVTILYKLKQYLFNIIILSIYTQYNTNLSNHMINIIDEYH